mgnify:CR=1 FL=1
MTEEQQAHFIGRLAAILDEAFAQTDGGPKAYALLLELSTKALVSIADDPQAASDGLLIVAQENGPMPDKLMRAFGIKPDDGR